MSLLRPTAAETSVPRIVTLMRQTIQYINLILPSQGHILGTATSDSAAAGEIGEVIQGVVTAASPVSLVTATAKTITSIVLTPGEWDVFGIAHFLPDTTTSLTNIQASISTTTNTIATGPGGGGGNYFSWPFSAFVPGAVELSSHAMPSRQTLAVATTFYLVLQATFTVSTLTARGMIRARRVR